MSLMHIFSRNCSDNAVSEFNECLSEALTAKFVELDQCVLPAMMLEHPKLKNCPKHLGKKRNGRFSI